MTGDRDGFVDAMNAALAERAREAMGRQRFRMIADLLQARDRRTRRRGGINPWVSWTLPPIQRCEFAIRDARCGRTAPSPERVAAAQASLRTHAVSDVTPASVKADPEADAPAGPPPQRLRPWQQRRPPLRRGARRRERVGRPWDVARRERADLPRDQHPAPATALQHSPSRSRVTSPRLSRRPRTTRR